MKKLVLRTAAVFAVVCTVCTAAAFPCLAAYEYAEFPKDLKPVPHSDFFAFHPHSEWYYRIEPLKNGQPQNFPFSVWEVQPPEIYLTAEDVPRDEMTAALQAVFPDLAQTYTEQAASARFLCQFLGGEDSYDLRIIDTGYSIAGMETYADTLFEAIRDRFTLTEYLYISKSGKLNDTPTFGSYWWIFSTTGLDYTAEEEADFRVSSETNVARFLAENYAGWHAEKQYNSRGEIWGVAVLPDEDTAKNVTFEQYTAILSAVSAATGYKVPGIVQQLGNNYVMADDLRYYGQLPRRGTEHSENYIKRYLSSGRITADGFPHFDFYDFARQLSETVSINYMEAERGAIYNPVRPAEEDTVGSWEWDSYEGILVQCEDGEAMKGTDLGGFHVCLGDAEPYTGEKPHVTLYPYESIMYTLNHNDALGDYAVTANLPAQYAAQPEKLWVLRFDTRYVLSLFDALSEDDRLHPIGILNAHVHIPTYFDNDFQKMLYILPAKGYSPETIDWTSVSERTGCSVTVMPYEGIDGTRYKYYSDRIIESTDAAEALSEALEACEEIAYAWVIGYYFVSAECVGYHGADVTLFRHYGTGDINGNDDIDLVDAVLLARAAGGTAELTPEARAEADLNADGSADSADLTLLLRILAGL